MSTAPLNLGAVKAALSTRTIGSRFVYLDSTDSTMNEAHREAAGGAPEGTVVVAEEQTGGRGRYGRPWYAPRGNLSCSVVLRPSPWGLRRLGMTASLAAQAAIRSVTSLPATLKWPNDVMVNGRKVCGIIVESSWTGDRLAYAILGVGVNVDLDVSRYPDIAPLASSLQQETGGPVSREDLLIALLQELDAGYARLQEGQSPREAWMAELETMGRWVQARWQDEVLEGRAESVDEEGNLILTLRDGTSHVVTAGEVLPMP